MCVRRKSDAKISYFIHELTIAQNECDESLYWLELLFTTENDYTNEFESMIAKATEIVKIFHRIILTTKQNTHNL